MSEFETLKNLVAAVKKEIKNAYVYEGAELPLANMHLESISQEIFRLEKLTPPRPAIRPLVWVYWECGAYAETPFGDYRITLDCAIFALTFDDNWLFDHAQIAEGQAAAEAHWQQKIGECLA